MVKVLVTGGAGFIGSNFVRYALQTHSDWHVTTLDKLTYAGRKENLHDVMENPRTSSSMHDILDAPKSGPLVEAADYVVHFAAEKLRRSIAVVSAISSRPTSRERSCCSRRRAAMRT